MKRKYFGVIHCVVTCYDCGKVYDDYKTARKKGYRHAKNTGHEVNVEVGTSYSYNPKK